MKTGIILSIICLSFALKSKSQSTVDKVNEKLYQAGQVQGTVDKVKGFFSKKKSKTNPDQTASTNTSTQTPASTTINGLNKTIITIQNIDFSKLKSFNENIQACQGVDSVTMKFSSIASTITVFHSGTTDQLLKLIEQTSKDIFTESNIQSFEEGSISLKL